MPPSVKSSATLLTLFLAAGRPALALNDWSVPCTQGKCSWDLPPESGSTGSVDIWGPVSAISDITPATGWQIMTKCNPTSPNQDIQLVCMNNNPNCNHLFQGNGAVNTIVRLPESCGPMPFARVAQHQILQSNNASRDNDSEAPAHQLTLDTDFAAAVPSQGGDVNFSLQGQNARDQSNAVDRRSHRRSRSFSRSQNRVYGQVDRRSNPPDLSLPTFNRTDSANADPVVFTGQKSLFSDGSSSTGININTNVQLSVGVSASAVGRIIPPQISQFGITFGLSGNADATLSFSPGSTSGPISSNNVTLFQGGYPVFSFPNILDITPAVTVLSRIDANFGIKNVNAVVDVNYDFGSSSFAFPPQSGSSADNISPSSKQVTFSADPEVGATLSASAHLIPQASLTLNAFSGIASTSIFLNVDASLGLQGSINASVTGGNPQSCLSGNADINVDIGAQGSFFGIFDISTGKNFDNNFPLFQQCFDGNTSSTTQSSSTSTNSASQSQSQTTATDSTTTGQSSPTGAPGSPPVVPPVVPPAAPPGGEPGATATDPASQATATDATTRNLPVVTIALNTTATDSPSQTSATNAIVTDSASQTSATDATTTDSSSQTIVANVTTTATDSALQTGATNATATDSASQTSTTDATTTDSSSQTIAANATATDSTSQTQTSATDATDTNSASQTFTTNTFATDSASQTSTANATETDSALQASVTAASASL